MKKWFAFALFSVIITVLLAGASFFYFKKDRIKIDAYKAIFLTNGQVYFGKVLDKNDDYIALSDIYYLQLKQPLQNQVASQQLNDSDMSLIKFGKELHGPTDWMEINREQIIFIEDLRPDSKVVKAIEDYKKR